LTLYAELSDGEHLAYDHFNFTPPWQKNDPVILVHGFSKNRKFWFEWIPDLARRYPVYAFDQRSHGDSSAVPEGFEVSLEAFARDIRDFMDSVGIARAHIIAADFTSSVGLVFGHLFPSRTISLVLPGFGYKWKSQAVALTDWIDLLEHEGSEAWARATVDVRLPDAADPAFKEWYVTQQGRMNPFFLASLFRYSPSVDLTDVLPRIKVPVLILAGSLARQETAASVREAQKLLPDCRLVMLEGMPFNVMSAAPQPCIEETLDFLQAQPTNT